MSKQVCAVDVPTEPTCDACDAMSGIDPENLWLEVESNDLISTYVTDRQRSDGSLLLLPRRHVGWIGELDEDEAAAFGSAIWRAIAALGREFGPDGWHLWTGSGVVAGQSMSHMHFQLVPRYANRPYSFAPSADLEVAELSARTGQAARLRRALATLAST